MSLFQAQFDFCHQCVLCHINSDNVYVNYQENTTNAWTRRQTANEYGLRMDTTSNAYSIYM